MLLEVERVGDWFADWIATITGKQVGFGDVPSIEPTLPYAIVYLLPSPRPEGAWSYPEQDQELVLQVTSVGSSPRQCGWMQTAVRNAVLERDANGSYTNAMAPADFTVWGRVSDGTGGIVKSGDRLFEVADTFRLKVSPA